MSLYEIFLKFLNIYFWIFIVFYFLMFLTMFTEDYKENKRNSIKNGTYFSSGFTESMIRWILFILSIQLT